MGYFANGTQGRMYEEYYCQRCIHYEKGCAVLAAHYVYNYNECNNDKSILNILIPINEEKCDNDECNMFIEHVQYDAFKEPSDDPT
jgi:hypothetical protein